jgi:serine/threonine protein kinase
MDRVEDLAPSQKRKLYELCWQFEEAWHQDGTISLQDWVSKLDDVNSEIVRRELSETLSELEMTSSPTGQRTTDTDRYEFIEEIARGGAAVVWRVRDRHLQRQSAIKYLMDSQDNRVMRSRLRREARICAKLVHPGVVPIHELSSFDDGRPFVCMKLIEGKTLLQLLKSSPPVSTERLIEVFTNACQAMAYAHDQNIIHRDLSPSNIMVGMFGEVQIMDWGLAKDLANREFDIDEDSLPSHDGELQSRDKLRYGESSTMKIQGEQTLVGSVFGTVAYLSPEQACGHTERIDKRSDVFSLGAILCRLLTGSPPYEDNDPAKLLLHAQNAELVPAVLRLGQSKFRDLSGLAMRCMSVDPNARPNDAGEIVAALHCILIASQRRKNMVRVSAVVLLVVSALAYAITRPNSVPSSTAPLVQTTELDTFIPVTDPAVIHTLLDTGNREIVLKSYRPALESNPSNVALHYLICIALLNAERFAESEAVAIKVIQLDDRFSEHFYMLSEAQYYQGKIEESYESLQKAAMRRESGRTVKLPVDEKLATRQKQVQWLSQLEASKTPPNCEPSEFSDIGQVCELTDRFELAVSYFNRALEQQTDPYERSLKRFLLLVGFVRKSIARDDLPTSQRSLVYHASIDWVEQQVAFAKEETDFQKPEAVESMKKSLIHELRHGESAKILKAGCSEQSLDTELRARFKQLRDTIANLP